jgi:hypothetical protein
MSGKYKGLDNQASAWSFQSIRHSDNLIWCWVPVKLKNNILKINNLMNWDFHLLTKNKSSADRLQSKWVQKYIFLRNNIGFKKK